MSLPTLINKYPLLSGALIVLTILIGALVATLSSLALPLLWAVITGVGVFLFMLAGIALIGKYLSEKENNAFQSPQDLTQPLVDHSQLTPSNVGSATVNNFNLIISQNTFLNPVDTLRLALSDKNSGGDSDASLNSNPIITASKSTITISYTTSCEESARMPFINRCRADEAVIKALCGENNLKTTPLTLKNPNYEIVVQNISMLTQCHTPIINLKHCQSRADDKKNDASVCIYAPFFIQELLPTVARWLAGKKFLVQDQAGVFKEITIGDTVTPIDIIKIVRNEAANTSGKIKFELYAGSGLTRSQIYTLKDIARFLMIIGTERAIKYGGYGGSTINEYSQDILIADLAGLQFQQAGNTGRLVIIAPDGVLPKGELDSEIYRAVVGKARPPYSDSLDQEDKNYIRIPLVNGWSCFFDKEAYIRFIAGDLCLYLTSTDDYELSFKSSFPSQKFLPYGTGAYAGSSWGTRLWNGEEPFKVLTNYYIYEGIALGLENLLNSNSRLDLNGKTLDFPFYEENSDFGNVQPLRENTQTLARKLGFADCTFSRNDPLKPDLKKQAIATTNSGDTHAPPWGNEGNNQPGLENYASVEAMLVSNMEPGSDNKFNPVLNDCIQLKYMNISALSYTPLLSF